MAITFVAAATASNAAQNTLTPAEPAGALEGDIIIASAGLKDGTGGAWTIPADFAELDNEDFGNAGNFSNGFLGWKLRGASAGSGYAFTSSAAASNMSVLLLAFRGVDQTDPFDVTFNPALHQNEISTGSTALVSAAPAITTVTDEAWVLLIQRWMGAVSGITHGVPANYTSAASLLNASRSTQAAYREIAVAGTETPGVWTTTGALGTEDALNWTLALRPLVASSGARGRMLLTGIG